MCWPTCHACPSPPPLQKQSPSAPSPDVLTGEDAYNVTEFSSHCLLAVADGVGGWASSGVDPSEFSWAIMNSCGVVAPTIPIVQHFPQSILDRAFKKVNQDGEVCLMLVAARAHQHLRLIRQTTVQCTVLYCSSLDPLFSFLI